ncbi:hypothetical protein [Streptomyces mangrovisoli]|uniref:Uncharacterized protein n=1 Tax=Streptomyces mangrovisoli TaxID=1428628 RepID=A0A1J4NSU5_9ACTN|nr:hypothetical protein [Streptomyces mangrovisoli]OIJ64206.1 hypothetical protein WN71_030090 [Streptomyces mangrovisoli]
MDERQGAGPVGFERLLGHALREPAVDREAAARALAAFRDARDSGAHRVRPRRRDDWRPGERRLSGR